VVHGAPLEGLHPRVPREAQVAAQPPARLDCAGPADADVLQLDRGGGRVKQQAQRLRLVGARGIAVWFGEARGAGALRTFSKLSARARGGCPQRRCQVWL
jgi:hypothetical protein